MTKSYVDISKQALSYLMGAFMSSAIVQVIFIFAAIHFNYFSGIDLASTVIHIPAYALIWAFIGLLIFIALKLLKVALISHPSEYFLVGVALGLGDLGSIFKFWFLSGYIETICYIVAVGCAIVLSMAGSNKETAR